MKERFFPVILDRRRTAGDGSVLASPLDSREASLMGGDTASVCFAPVYVTGSTTSTFDLAWDLARETEMPAWSGVLAASQTRGRGQLRREWVSPPGNLYVSFFLPDGFVRLDSMAPLATGYCVHAALRTLGVQTRIKWPNDLLLADAGGPEGKVGGLLLEERGSRLLAGLGLNLRNAPEEDRMRGNKAVPAVALPYFNEPLCDFWRKLAAGMRDTYTRHIERADSATLRRHIEAGLAWMGSRIFAEDLGAGGVLAGLDASGSLLLQTEDGLTAVTSGSIRPW
ncbi:MAG: biotin--[acetyl-CoA-carboxylase] ligase [Deltaproteobacteria bacterium]|nr:biotin--[acetyl-CoA-carboxylase] ligase [Deltaproteobacteria bacterium]